MYVQYNAERYSWLVSLLCDVYLYDSLSLYIYFSFVLITLCIHVFKKYGTVWYFVTCTLKTSTTFFINWMIWNLIIFGFSYIFVYADAVIMLFANLDARGQPLVRVAGVLSACWRHNFPLYLVQESVQLHSAIVHSSKCFSEPKKCNNYLYKLKTTKYFEMMKSSHCLVHVHIFQRVGAICFEPTWRLFPAWTLIPLGIHLVHLNLLCSPVATPEFLSPKSLPRAILCPFSAVSREMDRNPHTNLQ